MSVPFADRYDVFAGAEAAGQSAVYEGWARGVAGDERLRDLIRSLPPAKQQPNLVFACSRLLGAPVGAFGPWRDWVIGHWDVLAAQTARRATQTNEPRRLATILPLLVGLPGPLALIEVGASAGLCLYPDRYSYEYDGVRLDPADGPSTVLLPCSTSGAFPFPDRVPEVAWRAGIDLHPLDVANPDDVLWLETLIWPEQHERLARVRAAIELVRRDPPRLVAGDLVDALPGLVAQAPAGAHVVVFHSGVLPYVPRERRERFVDLVRELGVTWISQEGRGAVPGVDADRWPRGLFAVARDGVLAGFTGPHGQSIEWTLGSRAASLGTPQHPPR